MSDQIFEKLLAEQNQSFTESEAYSTWMPPDGEFIVSVSGVSNGVSTNDDDTQYPWWRLTGTIQEPGSEMDAAEFCLGYFTGKAYGMLKSAASVIANKQMTDNLKEASDVLMGSKGMLLKVVVKTAYSKKYKRDFTNCSLLEVINSEVATGEVEASAEVAEG